MLTDIKISVVSVVDTVTGTANASELPCCYGLNVCLKEGSCPEVKQETGSHQEPNAPVPWSGPSQPPEWWEIHVCCLSCCWPGVSLGQPTLRDSPGVLEGKVNALWGEWKDTIFSLSKFMDPLDCLQSSPGCLWALVCWSGVCVGVSLKREKVTNRISGREREEMVGWPSRDQINHRIFALEA